MEKLQEKLWLTVRQIKSLHFHLRRATRLCPEQTLTRSLRAGNRMGRPGVRPLADMQPLLRNWRSLIRPRRISII